MHNLTSLLVEVWLALKNRLKAEDILGAKITLIEEQHSTTTHRSQHWTFTTNSAAVNQLIRTNEVRLIGALRDVHTNQLTLECGTNLLNHHRLAVARKTSDVNGIEDSRTDNVLQIIVESERHIGAALLRNKRFSHILRTTRRKIHNLRNRSHRNCRNRLLRSRSRNINILRKNVERISRNLAFTQNEIRELLDLVFLEERIEFLERDRIFVIMRMQFFKHRSLVSERIIRLSHFIKLHHRNTSYKTIIAQKHTENNSKNSNRINNLRCPLQTR